MKLNLGCGPHSLAGWLNIDIEFPIDPISTYLKHDLSKGLPFNHHTDERIQFIYSEHFLEHLTKEQAEKLLRDCFRVLLPGGVIRISMPDLMHLMEMYRAGNINWTPECWKPKTPCQMVNEGMRLWGHQYLWDLYEITDTLKKIGFTNISRQKHHVSAYRELCRLEVRPDCGDLIVEATRPE